MTRRVSSRKNRLSFLPARQLEQSPEIPARLHRSDTIRASELGVYLYCQRAWIYQRQGKLSENKAEMMTGSRLHLAHGKTVLRVVLLRSMGYILLLIALILLVVYWTGEMV